MTKEVKKLFEEYECAFSDADKKRDRNFLVNLFFLHFNVAAGRTNEFLSEQGSFQSFHPEKKSAYSLYLMEDGSMVRE